MGLGAQIAQAVGHIVGHLGMARGQLGQIRFAAAAGEHQQRLIAAGARKANVAGQAVADEEHSIGRYVGVMLAQQLTQCLARFAQHRRLAASGLGDNVDEWPGSWEETQSFSGHRPSRC